MIHKRSLVQIVAYTPYEKNPRAADLIVEKAKKMLGNIQGTTLAVGLAVKSERAVVSSNNQVIMMTMWDSEKDREHYFYHPDHLAWCQFVLRGWMLEDSTAEDPEWELMGHILEGENKSLKWIRNPAIPDNEVVWGGEQVIFFRAS